MATICHRFGFHGAEYGISYPGGVGFRDDPRQIRLGELGLRATERFVYDCDFAAGWRLHLRVEQIEAAEPDRVAKAQRGRAALTRRTNSTTDH